MGAKCVIQGDFQPVMDRKTIGLSGSEFGIGVEVLGHAARELAFGPEPVEDKQSMAPQHAGSQRPHAGFSGSEDRLPPGFGCTRPNAA